MSLYNIVSGINPAAFGILPMLGKHPDKYPRFRDCFADPEARTIVVLTRTGGGNRDEYAEANSAMEAHPQYRSDADDEFDRTFARWTFGVPDEWVADFDAIMQGRAPSDAYTMRCREVFPKLSDRFGADDSLWLIIGEVCRPKSVKESLDAALARMK